ncbi:MAG: AAA family ATPase [Chitinispirillaceae bacterium]
MNPFRYGQVVTRKNYCRRPDLEKKLKSKLDSGQNTYIEGERRTGKTSLIFHTVEQMKSKWIIYIDLLEVKTVEDIHKRILNGMARAKRGRSLIGDIIKSAVSLRPVLTFDPITSAPSISVDSSLELKPESLEGLMDLFSKREFRNAVVAIDEFQDVRNLKNADQVLAVMRSKIQFLQDIPFVFCGSIRREMHTIFNDPQSPFFKSALPLDVGPIERTAFMKFIQDKFAEGKIKAGESTIDRILHITDENPGDTQQLCSAVYDISEAGSHIEVEKINEALQYLFAEERKGYEAHLARLTAIQLKCLTAVARTGGKNTSSREFIKQSGVAQPSTIRKALKRLEELKILFTKEGEYRFVNPFFAHWLVHMNY